MRRRGQAALDLCDEQLARLAATEPRGPSWEREYRDWLALRERSLRNLARDGEADQARDEIFRAPARPPGLDPRLIDLTAFYNGSLYDGRGWHTPDASFNGSMLPESFRPLHGVEFDLRGLIQLNSGTYGPRDDGDVANRDLKEALKREFPDQVTGIPVELKTSALHFLLGAIWGSADKGEEVARLIVHYADGSQEVVPLVVRVDICEWWLPVLRNMGVDVEREGWSDTDRFLCEKVWQNPHPDKLIQHVDFVSNKKRCGPFLVAITAE
jgi:hypothetical protein